MADRGHGGETTEEESGGTRERFFGLSHLKANVQRSTLNV
jgi:hypothetical protein